MLSLSERVPRKPDCHLIACPQVGEVVLIKDKLPCDHWKMGKISELIVVEEEGFKHDTGKSITVMNMERSLTIAQKMSPKVESQEQKCEE